MEATKQINKAKWYQVLGFSGNNAATNAMFLMLSLYFMVYCTEVYGFSPLLVGFIMTGTRLFDAVTDPLIGLAIDKTNTKFGRFRPWILGGAIFSAAMFVLMFSGIKLGSDTANLILVTVFYSLWVIGYTAQTACTKSAQTILTSEPTQRSMLNALGTMNTLIIYMFSIAALLPIVYASGGIQDGMAWRKAAMIIVGIQLVLTLFVILSLKSKDVKDNYMKLGIKELPKFKDYLSIFKENRALQMLVVAASTNKITQTMQSGLTVLFYVYVVQNQKLQGTVSIATLPLMIIATFVVVGLVKKFGRKEIFTLSSWGGFVYGIIAVFLISLNPSSMMWLILVMGINTILIAGAGDVNIISMIADSADYEYYRNNRFVPGMIGTSFSFIDKVISSFGSLITGAILTGIGFVSITETPQSSKMFWGVLIMYFAFPAIGHLCSIIGMKFYPLDKKSHEKMLVDLANKKEEVA